MSFAWQSRIRFVDTDASRRIHYTAILRHFEAAEHEFLLHIGFGYSQITTREVGFPRVHVEVDFQSAIVYNDLIDIEVSVGKVGTTSFTFLFSATVQGRQAASGKIVVVAMNPATKKSCPVPEALATALRTHIIPI
jgi:acyl-CoA thioester hydrolase